MQYAQIKVFYGSLHSLKAVVRVDVTEELLFIFQYAKGGLDHEYTTI